MIVLLSRCPPAAPIRGFALRAVALLATLLAVAAPLAAQAGPQPTAETRERLALGYLRLELALRDAASRGAARDAESRVRLNRGFDAATLQFFAGNIGGALQQLDDIVAELGGGALEERAARMLASLDAERRRLPVEGAELHYLLHLPARPSPEGGWPVVVAMHGMGGDERMFFGGYGAGMIRELADRHGLAVVTPRGPLSPTAVIGLVDALAAERRLDATRIALLGHSMGAGMAGRTSIAHPTRVRAVVCIAGSCGGPMSGGAGGADPQSLPPMLLFAGALDPLFRVDNLVAEAESQRQAGRSVEVRRLESEGHTLIVGEALPEAMAWLAAHLGG
jgi:predicted esterase